MILFSPLWHFPLANAGVPLFTYSLIYQLLLLIPIILVEAYVHRRILNISRTTAIIISFLTNMVSTFIGGILMLLLGVAIGVLIFDNPITVPEPRFLFTRLEIIVSLIPLFIMSVVFESLVGLSILRVERFFSNRKPIPMRKIIKSFIVGNGLTYLMLTALGVTYLIRGYFFEGVRY